MECRLQDFLYDFRSSMGLHISTPTDGCITSLESFSCVQMVSRHPFPCRRGAVLVKKIVVLAQNGSSIFFFLTGSRARPGKTSPFTDVAVTFPPSFRGPKFFGPPRRSITIRSAWANQQHFLSDTLCPALVMNFFSLAYSHFSKSPRSS